LPDGLYEVFTPDAAGQITRHADFAGATTSYTYDPMGRVLSRTYPDSTVVSFTYTPTGQRATATDARGTTRYAYDSRNRLVQLTYPDGRMVAYGYDAHGDRTTLTAKIGAQSYTTTTSYDAAGRPNQVKDPTGRAFTVTYDADGNRTQVQYPNTTKTGYTYDALNRLTNLTATQTPASGPPTTVTSFAYTLDVAGRRAQVTEADGTVRAYGYDSIDRLTSEAVTGALSYAKAFAYDPVGNRLTQTTTGAGAGAVSYTYDARDRLTNENGTTYAYDTNGNVTSKSGEANYTWDFQNRVMSAAMSDGTLVSHIYDVDGNRAKTTVAPSSAPASVTNFLVDASSAPSQVVADADANGSVTALYIRNGGELLAVMRPVAGGTWTTRFVHSDGLGSVRVLTDETGTTIDSRGYEAFGTKNVEAGSDPLTYGFAGEPLENTSHLAYHRARWMDSRVGRFEGMDPWEGNPELPETLHRYMYVGDNPANLIDPSGLLSPLSLFVGQQVHLEIGKAFVNGEVTTTLHRRVSDNSIKDLIGAPPFSFTANWAYKTGFGVGVFGRPDLAAKVEHAIYEIKAIDELGQGRAKLNLYLWLLDHLDPMANWRIGGDDEYTPPFTLILANTTRGDYFINVSPPEGGVITYTWKPYKNLLKLTAALGALSVAADLAGGGLALAAVGGGFL
jgi:RHS repeat-associated protein